MNWLVTNIVATLLLPPANCIILMILACYLSRKHLLIGKWLTVTGMALLALLSIPVIANVLLHSLVSNAIKFAQLQNTQAEAIVVLGGGLMLNQPEFGHDSTGDATLIRLRYANFLHRTTHLPILVTGGNPVGGEPEGSRMQGELTEFFHTPAKWVETHSENTAQNASYSYEILKDENMHRILLVTQAWHMLRAQAAFERAGFEVIAAPTEFHQIEQITILSFLPHASALKNSSIALHELMGLAWYKVRGYIG